MSTEPQTDTQAPDATVEALAACLQRHVELGGAIIPMTVRSCAQGASMRLVPAKEWERLTRESALRITQVEQ